ncbi:MAG: hypothetical protein KDJ22_04660 [Candidatus Competibacteraceae bacterium]|nr:hypothetical protein [Candidatus Competibacteraceae bacterium]MCP5127878.1 hypothetical protein [Gammaproteobacteria bacterium]HRX71978.1 hypothetical protein [Candidatus Competibacteraceae bacterium]
MNQDDLSSSTVRLLDQLQRSQSFHHGGVTGIEREFGGLRRWQSARLSRTYADLLANPRYRPAAEFFLDEIYGDRDFQQREHDLARIVPMMTRILPASVLHTAALALELNALSYELDAQITRILASKFDFHESMNEAVYVAAYRRCANYELRQRQIELVGQLGQDLRRIVQKPFIHTALKVAKTPARLAGVGELHHFLDAGFHAFRQMGQYAAIFIATIVSRESAILERMRTDHAHPLDLERE